MLTDGESDMSFTFASASGPMRRLPLAGALATLLAVGAAAPLALAQEMEAAHPAHVHSGTCETLGDVVIPLTDVTSPHGMMGEMGDDAMAATPADSAGEMGGMMSGEMMGATDVVPVMVSSTVVDVPLEDILGGEHAINVHESADAIDVYIACGNIGGMVTTDEDADRSELVIGLGELNDSGYSGVAWLGAKGEQTVISVVLIHSGMDHYRMVAGRFARNDGSPGRGTTRA
jgi:hypothetical protein